MTTCLLATTYFGPVQWYQKLHRYDKALVECMENYPKQTFRNRCVIASTRGIQALTVPVTHESGKSLTRDMRISNHGNWQHLHWNAISSAYGKSPFFEFYADDLWPFFEQKWEFLIDFNEAITHKICELIQIEPQMERTSVYLPSGQTASTADFREVIRPRHPLPDPDFTPRRYYQVFEQQQGFLPNLSILDLLFNEGNESILYL